MEDIKSHSLTEAASFASSLKCAVWHYHKKNLNLICWPMLGIYDAVSGIFCQFANSNSLPQ